MCDVQDWAPARIYLQREQGEFGSHTWCEDSVGDGDLIEEVAYVRDDAVRATTTPIYQIGAPGIAGHHVVWWDVTQEEYERQKAAGYMRTGIVYREAT